MKQKLIKALSLLLLGGSLQLILCSWGIWGHQHINRAAVFALPAEMRGFFYNHIDFITEESVVPDLRKYTMGDKAEGPRHYINPEEFKIPFDSLPVLSKSAHAQFTDSILQKYGYLPWHIQDMMDKLTTAFRTQRKTEIVFLAADLGHYLGDAHMPLHTSINHDGQLTNQRGIHSFWEAQLPEQFGSTYNFNTGSAIYINDVPKETWRIIRSSHQLADSILAIEWRLKNSTPADEIYVKDSTGAILKNKFRQSVYSPAYARKFHEALNGMVEKQMQLAIAATANFWYTAWVNAGKPDLKNLDDEVLTKKNKCNYRKDMRAWKNGKLHGLKTETEY